MTLEKFPTDGTIPLNFDRGTVSADENLLEWQEPDGCAPALGKYLFNLSGINAEMTQFQIKDVIYDRSWDGSRPHDIVEFYGWFYGDIRLQEDMDFSNIADDLKTGRFVQVLWHDDLPEQLPSDIPESEWGHWTAIKDINLAEGYLVMFDPSNAERVYDSNGFVITDLVPGVSYKFEKRKSYKMHLQEFTTRWYDTVDESNRVAEHLVISVDPNNLRIDSVL